MSVAEKEQRASLEDVQINRRTFDKSVVVNVSAMRTCRPRRDRGFVRRRDAYASHCWNRREFHLHLVAERTRRIRDLLFKIDVPLESVTSTRLQPLFKEVVVVDSIYILRRHRVQANSDAVPAPVAIQPHLVEMNHKRVARLGTFDVERSCQNVVRVDDKLAILVVAPRVEQRRRHRVSRLNRRYRFVGK